MEEIIHVKTTDVPQSHKNEHKGFEYYKRELLPKRANGQCAVSLYEIPPKKSAYPYHYHTKNEEAFYIIQGNELLETPVGEKCVTAGDFLFFPANEKSAHRLTNVSDTEPLVYLDFDTFNDIDVAFYPHSEKIGIWGKGINQIYKIQDQTDYYNGE